MKFAPKRHLFALSIAAAAAAAAASAAFGDTATLRDSIQNYPMARGTCAQTAALLATEAAQATGLTVAHAACAGRSDGGLGYDLVLDFQVNGQEEIVTTDQRADLEYVAGNYDSEAACQAALSTEKTLFQQSTGVFPAISYCYKVYAARDHAWEARVDGVGVPSKRPFQTSATFFSAPLGVPGTSSEDRDAMVEAALTQSLTARGITLRSVRLQFVPAYYVAVVSYYAAEPFELVAEEIAASETTDQCVRQTTDFSTVLSTTRGIEAPLYSFCGRDFLDSVVQLTGLYFNEPGFQLNTSDDAFDNAAACEAGKDGLISYHRDSLGEPVVGGYCSYGTFDGIPTGDNPNADDMWHVILMTTLSPTP